MSVKSLQGRHTAYATRIKLMRIKLPNMTPETEVLRGFLKVEPSYRGVLVKLLLSTVSYILSFSSLFNSLHLS